MINRITDLFRQATKSGLMFNTARLLSVDILQKASNLLLLPFFLKFMTQEEYGLYGYLVAIITVLSNYLPFNIHVVQGKLYYEYEHKQRNIMLFMSFVILMMIIIVLLGPVFLFGCDNDIMRRIIKQGFSYTSFRFLILPALLYATFSMLLNNYMLVSDQIKLLQKYNLVRLVLVNPGALVLLYFLIGDAVLTRFSYTYSIEILLILLFAIPYFKSMEINWNWTIFRRIINLCLPYVFGSVSNALFFLSDRFVLGKFGTLSALGIYNLGVTVASIIFIINSSVINSWLPSLFRDKDYRNILYRTEKLLKWAVLIYLFISLILFIGLFILIKFSIISSDYQEVMGVLPWLLAGQMALAVNSIYYYMFLHLERARLSASVSFFSNVLTIICFWFSAPVLGFYGVAYSLFLIGVLTFLVNFYLSKRMNAFKA